VALRFFVVSSFLKECPVPRNVCTMFNTAIGINYKQVKWIKQSTKKLRYSLLSAFFNFIQSSIDPKFQNPCDTPILRKLFKDPKPNHWDILEKEVVDEMIFRTSNAGNPIVPELMTRGGMRVGEIRSSVQKAKRNPSRLLRVLKSTPLVHVRR